MKKIILLLLIVIVAIGSIYSGTVFYKGYKMYQETMADIDIEEVVEAVRSRENYITIDLLPSHLLNAVIAVEDHRFMTHDGFDVMSFGRAIIRNIQENEFAAGGSTITQQLSKNLFFSFEKKMERKVAELIVAKQLESLYEKDEILELYLNVIYYGDGFENIYDASMGYFRKHPKDLSNAEATLLAGLPQAPSSYALIEHFDRGVERGFQVINAMMEHGYMTTNSGEALKLELKNVKLQVD
ncbi:MAG: transglycosylase domain-containing protein [Clostridiales bacterium]|nr:transglycosylase domain-containing protein [Clostridiales bacterium]